MSRDDPPADEHRATDAETTTTDADSMPDHDPDTTDSDSTDRPASDESDTDHEVDTSADEDVPVRDAEPAATAEHAAAQGRDSRRSQRDARTDRDLRTKLSWLALVVLTLVSLYMLGVFYSNASRFIRLWVGKEFEPLVQAAFALVLLALSLVGIVRITRGLIESNPD
ncbi:hypothetical protein [Haloarchaeobius sp. HME9146]|uniref:hypothetical protein n=1 Tax=Haloarchaeobius sp. HME9146 TaxID=2978732 RepID=UPI0021C14303|nr:hypothetical protein [Haloarchaeobius sp. HME9146]MCT9094558.1 hypothetical protein [Haloarchaeobius sp. HME9146]